MTKPKHYIALISVVVFSIAAHGSTVKSWRQAEEISQKSCEGIQFGTADSCDWLQGFEGVVGEIRAIKLVESDVHRAFENGERVSGDRCISSVTPVYEIVLALREGEAISLYASERYMTSVTDLVGLRHIEELVGGTYAFRVAVDRETGLSVPYKAPAKIDKVDDSRSQLRLDDNSRLEVTVSGFSSCSSPNEMAGDYFAGHMCRTSLYKTPCTSCIGEE